MELIAFIERPAAVFAAVLRQIQTLIDALVALPSGEIGDEKSEIA